MMKLVSLILLVALSAPSHAQSWIDITDADAVSALMTHIPQMVQQSRPEYIYWDMSDDIAIDGVVMTSAQIESELSEIVAASVNRLTRRSLKGSNPILDRLGPFQDFDLEVTNTAFTGDSCVVTCTYSLRATGERFEPGEVRVGRISTIHWRITAINGLFPMLRSEMSAEKGKTIVLPKKRK